MEEQDKTDDVLGLASLRLVKEALLKSCTRKGKKIKANSATAVMI